MFFVLLILRRSRCCRSDSFRQHSSVCLRSHHCVSSLLTMLSSTLYMIHHPRCVTSKALSTPFSLKHIKSKIWHRSSRSKYSRRLQLCRSSIVKMIHPAMAEIDRIRMHTPLLASRHQVLPTAIIQQELQLKTATA